MELRVEVGLLLAKVVLEYNGEKLQLDNVLIDTGCSDTIFNTDLMEQIGLYIDYNDGITTTMKNTRFYGSDDFIGLDFMIETNMIMDFSTLGISYIKMLST